MTVKLHVEQLETREVPAPLTGVAAPSGSGFFAFTGANTSAAVPNGLTGSLPIGIPTQQSASPTQRFSEVIAATLTMSVAGDLASRQGSTAEVQALGAQLRDGAIQSLMQLRRNPIARRVPLALGPADLQNLMSLSAAQGQAFDAQFAALVSAQSQRIAAVR